MQHLILLVGLDDDYSGDGGGGGCGEGDGEGFVVFARDFEGGFGWVGEEVGGGDGLLHGRGFEGAVLGPVEDDEVHFSVFGGAAPVFVDGVDGAAAFVFGGGGDAEFGAEGGWVSAVDGFGVDFHPLADFVEDILGGLGDGAG